MPADFPRRVRFAAQTLTVAVLMSLILPISDVSAQIAFRYAPEHLLSGEQANLYVEVTGSERIDGFLLALPASWTLDALRVVDTTGRTSNASAEPLVEYANRWLILTDTPLRPSSMLVLTVNPVSPSATSTATVTPVRIEAPGRSAEPRVLDNLQSRADLPVIPDLSSKMGRSADFSRRTDPSGRRESASGRFVAFDRAQMPGPWETFTLEVWLKTTAFQQIVLSTWSGRDGDPYPFELVVDGSGHIVSYQGTDDHHVSMRSRGPVADGAWHHVAVVHDTPAGWTRLVVDGVSVDSLVHRRAMTFRRPPGIAVGDRADPGAEPTTSYYTGRLDELKLWPEARTVAEIRESRMDPAVPRVPGGLRIPFDDDGDEDLDVQITDDSPFSLRGITGLSVRSRPEGVTIAWSAADGDAERFEVERSTDGIRYVTVGRVEAGLQADASYSIVDPAPGDGVMFYRVRELLPGGQERLSDAVKAGMGETDADLSVVLTGNFPNPFNPTTRISYTVRETEHVQLSVWDLSGQRVSMLVDETVSPGYHEIPFDAEGLPSGTYFVQLNTPDGTQTHQMVLMK